MAHCSVMRWCRVHYGVRPLAAMEAIISEWDKIFADMWAHLDFQDHVMVETHACHAYLAK